MIYDVPPLPATMIIAQTFNDIGTGLDSFPDYTASTSNTSSPVSTLDLGNYLKSHYMGMTVTVTNTDRVPLGSVVINRVDKQNDDYYAYFYVPRSGMTGRAKFVFEGYPGNAPTPKRWAMSNNNNFQKKRFLEAEQQMTVMISPLMDENNASAVIGQNIAEPSADRLPEGETISIFNYQTQAVERRSVVVYKGSVMLSSGAPLSVRLEYVQ
ncbi:hypothetical protein EBR96_05465 [bacterium]|nr:hypothetical protein [bacterium]